MWKQSFGAAALGVGIACGGCGVAQTHLHGAQQDQAAVDPHGGGDGSVTVDIQGDNTAWWSNPYNYAFYGVLVAAFANGVDEVDAEALDKAFMKVAHDFAVEMNLDPAMMQDHLKLIPGQMIEIVRDDPEVLESYENMMAALRGPE